LTPAPRKISWFRRLSVRIAVAMGLAMLAHVWLAPHLVHYVGHFFTLPHEANLLFIEDFEFSEDDLLWGMPAEADELAEQLLAGPIQEVRDRLAELVDETYGSQFILLDASGVIVDSSSEFSTHIGDDLTPELSNQAWTFRPLRVNSEIAGWLGAIDSAPLNPDEVPEDTILITEAEFEADLERWELIATLTSWLMVALLAFGMSLLMSWMITRRLTRLATAVQEGPVDRPEGLEVAGHDEIAALGSAVQESRTRVAELVAELEQRDTDRREWVAQVSHDLRTPLTALDASLFRARETLDKLPEGEQRDAILSAVEVAQHDSVRVLELASDLLEVARLELPNALILEELLPGEITSRVVRALGPLADLRGLKLRLDCPSDLPAIECDGNRLMRAFENLLKNAIEHAKSSVELVVSSVEGGVRFQVLDDGPGFADATVQADRSPRRPHRADSVGLGLVVVTRVLDAHGSSLHLERRATGGACASFVIALASG